MAETSGRNNFQCLIRPRNPPGGATPRLKLKVPVRYTSLSQAMLTYGPLINILDWLLLEHILSFTGEIWHAQPTCTQAVFSQSCLKLHAWWPHLSGHWCLDQGGTPDGFSEAESYWNKVWPVMVPCTVIRLPCSNKQNSPVSKEKQLRTQALTPGWGTQETIRPDRHSLPSFPRASTSHILYECLAALLASLFHKTPLFL